MKVVTVIPLARGIPKENLTYFTAKDVSVGSVVAVPLRKKTVNAIVVGVEDLSKTKGQVKASDFKLRKIHEIKGPSILPEEFWQAIIKTKKYFATTTGAAVYSLLPKVFFESYTSLTEAMPPYSTELPRTDLKQEKLALQLPLDDRLSYYKTIIREAFSKKSSIFFCLPTLRDLNFFYESLSKGIEEFVFIFRGDIKKKEFIKKYNGLIDIDHPKVIFGTPNFLFLTSIFKDVGQIILEKESSSAYRTISRPFIDQRFFSEALSGETRAKIIFADKFLRIQTLYRVEEGEITEFIPLSFRFQNSVKKELVDPREEWKKENVLSETLKTTIVEAKNSKKRIFLFALRKGFAGLTICNDCKTILLCDNCSAPMTLYGTENKSRVFVCNKCKSKKSAETKCEHCQSWNLKPLGIGVERVEEELKKNFKNPGAILVGTETVLFHLEKKIDYSAIVSFDSLFSIPSFNLSEKIIHLISALEELTAEKIIIQSKNTDEPILQAIMGGNLSDFYRYELTQRKKLFYPPFSIIIKITRRGNKNSIEKDKERLAEIFKEYDPSILLGFIPKVKKLYVLNTILKIDRAKWVDERLLSKLLSLPADFSVQVDAEDLL